MQTTRNGHAVTALLTYYPQAYRNGAEAEAVKELVNRFKGGLDQGRDDAYDARGFALSVWRLREVAHSERCGDAHTGPDGREK